MEAKIYSFSWKIFFYQTNILKDLYSILYANIILFFSFVFLSWQHQLHPRQHNQVPVHDINI